MADTTMARNAVAGLFQDEGRAEKAMDELKAAGFSESDIGVATRADDTGKTNKFWDKVSRAFGKQEHAEHATELKESLQDSGIPESQAQYLDSRLASGGILVTVYCDGTRRAQAASILERNGADLGAGTTSMPMQGTSAHTTGERRIQLLGEILRVHKERVGRGEVRLRKEVITENQNLEVPVSREELVVERVPVQHREATNAQIGSSDKEIRIPLSEEHVKVEKKPVVNEEIRVGKREVQTTEHVSDQVRHEELRSEDDIKEAERLNSERLREQEAQRVKDKGKRIA